MQLLLLDFGVIQRFVLKYKTII